MEFFRASERLRKTKWSFFVLLSDSERPNGVFSCFWATHKDQMEFFRAFERLRKAKWSFFVLLSDSETQKRGFWMSFSISFAFIRRNAMLITRHFFFWNKTNLFQIGFEVLIEVDDRGVAVSLSCMYVRWLLGPTADSWCPTNTFEVDRNRQ